MPCPVLRFSKLRVPGSYAYSIQYENTSCTFVTQVFYTRTTAVRQYRVPGTGYKYDTLLVLVMRSAPTHVDPLSNWLRDVRFHLAWTGHHIKKATTVFFNWLLSFTEWAPTVFDRLNWTCIMNALLPISPSMIPFFVVLSYGHQYPKCLALTPVARGFSLSINSN